MQCDAAMIRWGWASLLAMALALGWTGCGDDGSKGGGDGGTDSDSDSDSDTDSDTDADTDTGPFEFDAQRVYDDMIWLCEDERDGRLPGTEGNEAALDYVEAYFEDMGLVPAGDDDTYRQHFTLDIWQITGDVEATVDSTALEYGTDFSVFSYSGSGDVTAEMVFVGHGMTVPAFDASDYPSCPLDPSGYDDFDGIDVTDKIALVIRHGPDDLESIHDNCPANEACATTPCLWNFGYKAANSALHGAVGMILVNNYQDGPEFLASGTIGTEYFDADFPGIFAHRDIVEDAVADMPTWSDTIDTNLAPDSHATGVNATINVSAGVEEVEVPNLLGAVEGVDPDIGSEVVVIGAHIDHLGSDAASGDIYNGCDDNASGTAVMTELARAMAWHDEPPARTVLFASWNAEEMGLIGSTYYVGHPTFPLGDHFAAYSIDMVGGGSGVGLAIYGGQAYAGSWLMDVMVASAAEMELDYNVTPADPLYASDHAPFAQASIPAVMSQTIGAHGYYHTPSDDPTHVLLEDVEAAMWMMWAGLLPLAMGTEDDYLSKYLPPMAAYDPRLEDAKHWMHRDK